MFHDNVEVEILSASDNNEKQIKDIQYFIDKKVDILVVSPNESAPVTPIVEKAFDLGIPVIVTDRKVLSEKYNAYIGPDNYEIGKLAGDYVVKYLNGNGNIVEIKGTAGSTPAIERHEGFMSIVRNYPEIKIIFQDDAVFLKSLGKKKMQEALKKHSKIDLVFAHNDRMAQGAYIAAQEMGREKKIRFVGIDAVPGYGIDQVIDGTLDVTFMNPTGGDKIIQLALDILNHNEFPTEITLPTNIVDKRNARVLKLQSDYIDQQKGKINSLNNKIDSYFARYATQRAMLYSSLILLLLVFILFFLTLKSNKSIKYLNSKLYKQNHETNSQKEQLEKQRDQLLNLSKQLEEATHSKLMFFTNISHDFLTPLTLVIEPIKQLILNRNLSRKQLKLLQLIEKNINILVHLVKQILDFRKYEEGKMELILSKNDLKVCLEEWNKIFLPSFINNKIKFSFNINENFQDYSCFDPYKTRAFF
jgi:ABC-type sugar transport system substrate-binding protein